MVWERLNRLGSAASSVPFALIGQKSRPFFILIAIAAISYAVVGLFYGFAGIWLMQRESSTNIAATSASPGSAMPGRQPADTYAFIGDRNLFGSTERAVGRKSEETAVKGPDISLVLVVRGTVAGTGKDGFAVIEERGKNKQVLYKVGSVVAGAQVARIERNAVVFKVGEREEVLKIPQTHESPLLSPAHLPQPTTAKGQGPSGPIAISREEVNDSLQNIGTMLSQAQIRPYYTGGVPDGFMITNIKPGSIYERIGLTNGDIIQGTDDRRLSTADDLTALYNEMKNESSLVLRIRRGGREESLHYVFR